MPHKKVMMKFNTRSVTNTLNPQIKLDIKFLDSNSVFFKQIKQVNPLSFMPYYEIKGCIKLKSCSVETKLLCALYDKCKNFLSCIQLWNNKNEALWTEENDAKRSLNRPIAFFFMSMWTSVCMLGQYTVGDQE